MSFVVTVLVAALVAATIWWLQRQQVRGRAETIERSRELPPLSNEQLPDFRLQPTTAATPTAAPAATASPASPATIQLPPAGAAEGETVQPAGANHWQDQVKLLKDSGALDSALNLCQQEFPKAQAFQQAAIVLRLQMKRQLELREDIAPLLAKLYRCAVLADLFRNGVAPKPANARAAMKQLAAHEFDYQRIGHQQLKLLSKSDIRLIEQRWGVPAGHCHGEAALGALWDNICR